MPEKFYQLTPDARRRQLTDEPELLSALTEPLSADIADHLIENFITTTEIPTGVCFITVDGQAFTVPMATEEPSVIAAANSGAKLAGAFTTLKNERFMSGQIVWTQVSAPSALVEQLNARRTEIFKIAKRAYPSIYARGGGMTDFKLEIYENWLSLTATFDTKDAMGANMINTMLEAIATYLRELFPEETILFSILSNEVSRCVTVVETRVTLDTPELMQKIAWASDYAKIDSMRTATHNKGILNGVDAAVLALGNDTRAIYLANNLTRPLATWTYAPETNELIGQIEIHLPIGTQGGATSTLPRAKAAFSLLKTRDAKTVASVIAAIGLANNLAALKALTTTGIQKGHMALQARTFAMNAGAVGSEIDAVAKQLKKSSITLDNARKLLKKLRN
ncbi:MAG: 3-hydroxy-3-methylglutaryl-CoA reductase [Streptococcaceae bacterium]|jgi:hydroxymethylglutaryl-CoA reductase|nr:3-hydroxy-3-methylglutaryl-CoA reductase [Streptococcaceae bacterium]